MSACSALWRAARRGLAATSTLWRNWDPDARIGLFRLLGLERRLGDILGRPVDLLPEPIEPPRLRAKVERDRRSAF